MKHILGILLLVAANSVFGASWKHVGNDASLTVEIDVESVSKEGALTKAWFRYSFAKAQKDQQHGTYVSEVSLHLFDCKGKKIGTAQFIRYADKSRSRSINRRVFRNAEWELSDVIPETFSEAMLERACFFDFLNSIEPMPAAK